MARLTDREKAFCEYYVLYWKGAPAAFKAGYSKNPKDARYRARELLKKPEIQEYIEELRSQWRERLGITIEKVLEELSAIAFADIRNFAEWNDLSINLKDSAELKRRHARAIAEVRNDHVGEDGNGQTKIKLHSKERALELLGKHLGLFKDETDVNHKGEIRVTVKRLTGK